MRNVSKIDVHPFYRKINRISDQNESLYFNVYYDYAILTLSEPVEFDKKISPICLPEDPNNRHDYEKATVTGWGSLWKDGPFPEELTEVSVSVLPLHTCNQLQEGIFGGLQE